MDERVLQRTCEGGDEHLALSVVPEGRAKSPYENAGVRADGGLRVALHLGEMAEEVIV